MKKKEKRNIIIYGSYSGNNKGDLAILQSIIENINRNIKSCVIYVPSKQHRYIKKYIKSKNVIFFKSLTNYLGLNTLYYSAKSDVMIVGGGGLFFDRKIYNPFFNHIVNLFSLCLLNRFIFKKKIYILSVGCSHLESYLGIFLSRWILNNSDEITVRDVLTYNKFTKLTNKPLKIFYDPVFALTPKRSMIADKIVSKLSDNKKKVIFCVTKSVYTISDEIDLFKTLVLCLRKLQEKYSVLICQTLTNQKFAYKLYKDANVGDLHLIEKNDFSGQEFIYFMSLFDIAISMPMHGSIFAYVGRTKLINVVYDEKVIEFNKIINNKNYVFPSDIDKIPRLVENVLKKDNNVESIIKIRSSALSNFDNFSDFLKRSLN